MSECLHRGVIRYWRESVYNPVTYMLSGCYIEITFKSRRHLITWSEVDQVFLTFNYCVCLEDLVHSVVLFYQGIILKYGIEGTHNQKKNKR